MTDADKILQALAGLQHTVEKQGRSIEALHEGQKSLQGDVKSLQEGQKTLQATVEQQGKQLTTLQHTVENQSKSIAALQDGQKALQAEQQTLELKVEAFHTEQRRANDEILGHLITSNEVNGKAHKELEKRVDRIEKHLNLPPVK